MSAFAAWMVSTRSSIHARTGRAERGATMTEYALLVTLMSAACVVAVAAFGGNVSDLFNNLAGALS
jgi:Flp pilus assembly pilin Flp